MTSANDGISVNHNLIYENSQLVKMIAITRLKKSTKFQSNTEIFDGDMTSSYFDVILDNLRRHN